MMPKTATRLKIFLSMLIPAHCSSRDFTDCGWLAFDPWLRPAPSDDGYFDLETLLDMECEGYVPAPAMSLHLAVVRGVPENSAEQFLNTPPAVLSCDATEASAVESDR